jgi:hypothetical protein
LWLFGKIEGKEKAEIVQLGIEYDPHPPFDSGHPSKATKEIFKKSRNEMLFRAKNPRDMISVPKILWNKVLNNVRKKNK